MATANRSQDRTVALHPVNWQIERLSPSGYYAFGFGGGLDEPVCTDGHKTEEEALSALKVALRKLHRRPDPTLANTRTDKGAAFFAILND